MLIGVVHDFCREISTRPAPPRVYCFFEERQTKFGAIAGFETDEPTSPAGGDSVPNRYLGICRRRMSGTLSGHPKVRLALGHFEMDKFEDSEDSHYQSVSSKIKKMVEESKDILEGRRGETPSTKSTSASEHSFALLTLLPFKEEPNFIGRCGILQQITDKHGKTETVVLCGSPGIGKTHVAIKYAHKFTKDYPSSRVCWVNAASAEQFEQSYMLIANASHLSLDAGKGVLETVRCHLKRESGGRWLVVLDGLNEGLDHLRATNGPHTGESLLDFIPKTSHIGKILATTRSRTVANRLVQQKEHSVVDLPAIDDRDAAKLLLGSESAIQDAAKLRSAARVARELGSSPVALTLAYAYRSTVEKMMPLSRYLEAFRSLPKPKNLSNQAITIKEEAGVRRAWQLLWNDLAARHPDTSRLLLLISILDVQSLSTSFLAEAVADRDVERHIQILVRYGMVEPYVNRTAVFVTDLVRQCARAYMVGRDETVACEVRALSLIALLILPPKLPRRSTTIAAEARRDHARLLFKVATHMAHQGQHQAAILRFEACLQNLHHLGLEDEAEKAQHALGETTRAHAATKEVGETPSPHNSSVLVLASPGGGSGGGGSGSSSRTDESESPLDLDLGLVEKENFNLALEQARQGNYQQAEKGYQGAWQASERRLGGGHFITLRIMGSLAQARCAQGRVDEGWPIMQHVLTRQSRLLGPNHPDTVVTRHNAAYVSEHLASDLRMRQGGAQQTPGRVWEIEKYGQEPKLAGDRRTHEHDRDVAG
ncbi:P-loop containing nucleoside triphosphate hydrolase protein [Lasiosphaeria miniovina]|uniref:P-loop containing nucleoside triphosphate hydrolase protein n=1 Tax=Lasiosphaeria miniovina TaxID=1954250 RepID=A0AA40DJT0_9PEZI|nr:P-loop containing nucleoside triphosphate hydrolase protein [Lasiosphaeria miniovina]KAK0703971.1 P-loop containing nucleoside triphosphate hydrolase protein [Lasiosphaeria miniovina]